MPSLACSIQRAALLALAPPWKWTTHVRSLHALVGGDRRRPKKDGPGWREAFDVTGRCHVGSGVVVACSIPSGSRDGRGPYRCHVFRRLIARARASSCNLEILAIEKGHMALETLFLTHTHTHSHSTHNINSIMYHIQKTVLF
jgi:hypothetical protein